MEILDHYIARAIFMSTLMVSVVIVGIESFLTLIQEFRYVGENHYGMAQVFLFVPMQLPAQFYQVFPIAGFIGALIGLGRLSSTSQLIVMRASGVSVFRIAWSVMKAAILMIIIVKVMGEIGGSVLQQAAATTRQHDLFPLTDSSLLHSIWLHDGNSYTYIGKLQDQSTLSDIRRYHFSQDGHLLRITTAKSAQLIQGQWILSNPTRTVFNHNRVVIQREKQNTLNVIFQPVLQIQMRIASAEQSLINLYHTIQYRQSIGLSVNQFVFSFWQRILQPVTSFIMISLAVPFVFGSFRSTSMGVRIIAGVLIGFAFYMMYQLFGPITLVYQFPPLLAAIIPPCVFFLIGIVLLLRVK